MNHDATDLQVGSRLGENCDTANAGSENRGIIGLVVKRMTAVMILWRWTPSHDLSRKGWPQMQCGPIAVVNVWAYWQSPSLAHLDHLYLSLKHHTVWLTSITASRFSDHHENCAHNCDFEMQVRRISRRTKSYVWWYNAQLPGLSPPDCSRLCGQIPSWYFGWELGHLLLR